MKTVCGRFVKRCEWGDKGSSGGGTVAARKLEGPSSALREETRGWLETGSTSTSVVKGPSGGVALEERTQMVHDLQIAQARRDGGEHSCDRRPPVGHRCLWCDTVDHIRNDCGDFAEALRANVVYLCNGQVHASETRRALELNIGRGGMKRLLEERVRGKPLFEVALG